MCLPSRSPSPPKPDPEIAVAQEEANDNFFNYDGYDDDLC